LRTKTRAISGRLSLEEAIFRPRQAEIFPQRPAFILGAENPPLLQFRHHLVDEIVKAGKQDADGSAPSEPVLQSCAPPMLSLPKHFDASSGTQRPYQGPGSTPAMDPIRRTILATGVAATAVATAGTRLFAQQTGQGGAAMGTFEKGAVRIHFEEAGSGFPLLVIAGGGLNSTLSGLTGSSSPFNPMEEFKAEYRCIASDLRNAKGGQSSGPLEVDRPWDAYTDDHLGLMDHLGIDKFQVLGFCIGGPLIWNLLRRAPDRVVAAVLAQPSGSRPEMRDLFYENNMKGWGPELIARRPEISMEMVDKFLTRMYRTNPDFVFTVTRDFVRNCQTPVLILPDDIPAHPYAVAMEAAMLAPKAEVSMFPWKEPKERIPLAVRQIRSFLRAHLPA
jgi:pimeloyl-ACP methyl ester carboxylesterase